MTPWVLFKLDGGLDHILVDESQDTNPEQWEIMRAIADEFFAGEGARTRPRERSSPWAIRNNRSLVSSAQTPRSATARAIICNRVLKPFPNLGDRFS